MIINTLKASLTKIVPIELSINLDFWYPIRDSIRDAYWAKKFTPIAVPKPFLHYLSHKYNYPLDMIKSEEYVNHIVAISKKLYDDPKYFSDSLSGLPINNSSCGKYFRGVNSIPQPYKSQTVTIHEPYKKDRKMLLDDTPLAKFTD